MKRKVLTLILIVISLHFIACGSSENTDLETGNSSENTIGTSSVIHGNAIKGPIDGSEITLYSLDPNGVETEIVAQNAPVFTTPSGSFTFEVNPSDLSDTKGPLLLRSSGGIMGGGQAPELEVIIPDPSGLQTAGQAISRHLSTASSVAAQMLRHRILNRTSTVETQDAENCIEAVEAALEVDLDEDPSDETQSVAMVNIDVDENLDLFNQSENNAAVDEYVQYLAYNLSSSSGRLDEMMEDPEHPGEDVEAHFDDIENEQLSRIFPKGPSEIRHLMVRSDRQTILNDGVDAATISLRLKTARGRADDEGNGITLTIISGDGYLSDTNPPLHRGRASVSFTSTMAGVAVIEASHTLQNGNTISQVTRIEVLETEINASPVADAGSDQTVATGDQVTLVSSNSNDTDSTPLTYTWRFVSMPEGSTANLSDPGISNPSFTADVAGDYVVELIVSDGELESDPAMVTITAVSGNSAPIANAGPDQNVAAGTTVTLDGSASQDINNDPLGYSWRFASIPQDSTANFSDPSVFNPSFIADVAGVYIVELIVNDGDLESDPATVTITAATSNTAPIADAGPDQNVATGTTVTLDGSASQDADNNTLTHNWALVSIPTNSSAVLTNANESNPTFATDMDGVYVAELIVNDGKVDSAPSSVTITAATDNSAPIADAGQDQNVTTGSTVTLDGSASQDADNDPLTYSWTLTGKPSGSTATLSNANDPNPVLYVDIDGVYVAELIVNDGVADSLPATISITASTINSAPIADAGTDQEVTVGTVVTVDGTGSSDADSDPLTYSWSIISQPSSSTAMLPDLATDEMVFFTPDIAGTYVIQLVVNDGLADSDPVTVTITAVSSGPDGATLFANCIGCHDSSGSRSLVGISAATIESKLANSHMGMNLDTIGGSAGAQAIADYLAQ